MLAFRRVLRVCMFTKAQLRETRKRAEDEDQAYLRTSGILLWHVVGKAEVKEAGG